MHKKGVGIKHLLIVLLFLIVINISFSSENVHTIGNTSMLTYNFTADIYQIIQFNAILYNTSNSSSYINNSNVSCELYIDNNTYNMIYSSDLTGGNVPGYYYNLSFNESKDDLYNISCNATIAGFDYISGTASYIVYNAYISSNYTPYYGVLSGQYQPIKFYANYVNYTGNSIENATCKLNISSTIFDQVYDSSNEYYYTNVTLNTSGFYNYSVTCNKTNYSVRITNSNITLSPYKPLFTSFHTLEQVYMCSNSFISIDNDNNTDYYFTGDLVTSSKSYEYVNNNFSLTNYYTMVDAVKEGSFSFSDFDNDGDADLIVCGYDGTRLSTSLYRNDDDTFVKLSSNFTNLTQCSISTFDFDNDGLIDIVISGAITAGSAGISKIYKNNNNFEFSLFRNIQSLYYSTTSYADINNDSNFDLFIFGNNGLSVSSKIYYANDSYTNMYNTIAGLTQGSASWFDIDNDDDMDLIVQGSITKDTMANSKLFYYENNAGTLSLKQTLNGHYKGTVSLADFDNDGDADLYVTGSNISNIYSNEYYTYNGTHFVLNELSIINIVYSSTSLFDFDNDGDLDIAICGYENGNRFNSIFTNNISLIKQNHAPDKLNLSDINATYDFNSNTLNISWTAGTDDWTPSAGLYYHLMVGTATNPNSALSGVYSISSNPQQGYLGNMMQRRSIALRVPAYDYQIRVQVIDSGLKRSEWSDIYNLETGICDIPTSEDWNVSIDCDKDELNKTFSTDQKLIIKNGATLRITDSNIYFNNTNALDSIIIVNGTLILSNTTIQNINDRYSINASNYSNLQIINSNLYGMNKIMVNNCSIINSSIIELDEGFIMQSYNSTITNSDLVSTISLFNLTSTLLTLYHTNINVSAATSIDLTNSIINHINVTYNNFSQTAIATTNSSIYFKWYATFLINDTNGNNLNQVNTYINNSIISDQDYTLNNSNTIILTEKKVNQSGDYVNNISIKYTKNRYFESNQTLTISDNTYVRNTLESTKVPDYSKFNNAYTTNFTAYALNRSLGNIANATIHSPTYGYIKFNGSINFTDLNLSNAIDISYSNITIDTTNYPQLNKSALIVFRNLSYAYQPILFKDGYICNYTICRNQTYSVNNFTTIVNGFSSYYLIPNARIEVTLSTGCHVKNIDTEVSVRYINTTSGAIISGGICNITGTENHMSTSPNSTSTYNNTNTGDSTINIVCWHSGYETVSYNTSFYVRETNRTVRFSKTELNDLRQSAALFTANKDLIISGVNSNDINELDYYRNSNDILTEVSIGIAKLKNSNLVSFDYNNDKFIDLIISGDNDAGSASLKLYSDFINNNIANKTISGGYVNADSTSASIDIADYDNDGDYDFLVSGLLSGNPTTTIYENDDTIFTQKSINVGQVKNGAAAFIDYNKDGLKDIIVTGNNGTNVITKVYYKSSSGSFVEDTNQSLPGYEYSSISIGDINLDGYEDLFIIGETETDVYNASIYLNINSVFVYNDSLSQNIDGLRDGGSVLFDYDIDGDFDLIVFGRNGTGISNTFFTKLFENNITNFIKLDYNFTGATLGTIATSDYDHDGDLDILITGTKEGPLLPPSTELYINDISECISNDAPSIPDKPTVQYNSNKFNIFWNQSTDSETTNGLYYNVKIGNTFGTDTIMSSVISTTSKPTNPGFGNVRQSNNITLNLTRQCLNVSVQSIDHTLQRSNWSNYTLYSSAELCDGIDQDCDGVVDNGFDSDNDGYYYGSGCSALYSIDNCPTVYNPSQEDKDHDGIGTACDPIEVVTNLASGGGSGADAGLPSTTETTKTETQEQNIIEEPIQETVVQTEQSLSQSEKNLIKNVLSNNIRHTREWNYLSGKTFIYETLRNYNPFAVHDISVTINIPKEVINDTDQLLTKENYFVIQKDPIILYSINELGSFKEHVFEYQILDKADPKEIQISLNIKNDTIEKDFQQLVEDTKEVLEIKKKVTKDFQTNTTNYEIDLDFKNESILYNVTIYQEIPKCLIEFIKQEDIISDIPFEIVAEDPLIAWHFDQIVQGEKINFAIKALAESDCNDEGETLAVAKSILILNKEINYQNILITFAIILAVLIILGIFSTISNHVEHEDQTINQLILFARKFYKKGGSQKALTEKLKEKGLDDDIIKKVVSLNSKNWLHKLFMIAEIGLAETIIIFIILLNFLEAFQILPGDIGFVKNIISWTVLSYLLYDVSITKTLFGVKSRTYDILLLTIFFSMTLKNFAQAALTAILDTTFFRDIYTLAVRYAHILDTYTLIIGISLIFFISIIFSLTHRFQNPSVVNLLRPVNNIFLKIIMSFLALLFFFVAIYNLMFEWLAIAIDAPLTVILIISAIYFMIKHHESLNSKTLFRLGSLAEGFYHKIIEMFQYRMMFPIAVSGILILHVLSDAGIYILPAITGLKNNLYASAASQIPLFSLASPSLFASQILGLKLPDIILLLIIYMANIIFIILLFMLPAYLWYMMYKHRKQPLSLLRPINISRPVLLLLTFSAIIFWFIPTFSFQTITTGTSILAEEFNGITLSTHPALTTFNFSIYILSIALLITVILHFLLLSKAIKRIYKNMIFLFSTMFISYYLYGFAATTLNTNFSQITELYHMPTSLFAVSLLIAISIILIINLLFYSLGTILLFIELWKRREFPFEYIKLKFTEHLTKHHDMHHVHYYGVHDELRHGDALSYLKNYMEESLKAGHGILRIEEFLEEHDWPKELILQAKGSLESTKRQLLHKDHLNLHKHDALKKLEGWIRSQLNENTTLEIITEQALDHGWTEDDVNYVFSKVEIIKDAIEDKDD